MADQPELVNTQRSGVAVLDVTETGAPAIDGTQAGRPALDNTQAPHPAVYDTYAGAASLDSQNLNKLEIQSFSDIKDNRIVVPENTICTIHTPIPDGKTLTIEGAGGENVVFAGTIGKDVTLNFTGDWPLRAIAHFEGTVDDNTRITAPIHLSFHDTVGNNVQVMSSFGVPTTHQAFLEAATVNGHEASNLPSSVMDSDGNIYCRNLSGKEYTFHPAGEAGNASQQVIAFNGIFSAVGEGVAVATNGSIFARGSQGKECIFSAGGVHGVNLGGSLGAQSNVRSNTTVRAHYIGDQSSVTAEYATIDGAGNDVAINAGGLTVYRDVGERCQINVRDVALIEGITHKDTTIHAGQPITHGVEENVTITTTQEPPSVEMVEEPAASVPSTPSLSDKLLNLANTVKGAVQAVLSGFGSHAQQSTPGAVSMAGEDTATGAIMPRQHSAGAEQEYEPPPLSGKVRDILERGPKQPERTQPAIPAVSHAEKYTHENNQGEIARYP